MEIIFKKQFVPPVLRINFSTSKSLGDNPIAKIVNPLNFPDPKIQKVDGATNQYLVIFDPRCQKEIVDIKLISADFSLLNLLKRLFCGLFFFLFPSFWKSLFSKAFWSGMLHMNFNTFFAKFFIGTGLLMAVLITLEVVGVDVRSGFTKWLDQLTMAETYAGKIRHFVGMDGADPFFKSAEAGAYFDRTRRDLSNDYEIFQVTAGDEKYRLLVRKNFLPATDLDDAADVCGKEIDAYIAEASDYQLFMSNPDIKSYLNLAYAEWTDTSESWMPNDNVELFLPTEHKKTWQANVDSIKRSDTDSLNKLGTDYGILRDGMDNQDYQVAIIAYLNKQVGLPSATIIKYDDGVASFSLDEDDNANYRCVRRLELDEK